MRPRRRAGVTLLEVLVTIFIMAIGMLALLVLFPLGALEMARALKDDRCASACYDAIGVATVQNFKNDTYITSDPTQPALFNAFTNPFPTSAGTAVNLGVGGTSYGVYVDPFGYSTGSTVIGALPGTTPGMFRASISLNNDSGRLTRLNAYRTANGMPLLTNNPSLYLYECYRWCELLDDIDFTPDGTPNTVPTGGVTRAGRYTWAWLLRQQQAGSSSAIDVYVIVYQDRDTSTAPGPSEPAYSVTSGGAADTNFLTISYPAGSPPKMKTGRWILDTTPVAAAGGGNNAVPGYFYRVVNYTDLGVSGGTGTMQLELETNLRAASSVVVVMDSVAEVFYRGTL
jgi:prepilin-type N-terminal cleavage/methylation domain-containing protein